MACEEIRAAESAQVGGQVGLTKGDYEEGATAESRRGVGESMESMERALRRDFMRHWGWRETTVEARTRCPMVAATYTPNKLETTRSEEAEVNTAAPRGHSSWQDGRQGRVDYYAHGQHLHETH
jgi:hypothetical protein